MAGSDPTAVGDVPLIDVDAIAGRLEDTNDLLSDIRNALLGPSNEQNVRLTVDAGTALARLGGGNYTSHTRLRVRQIILSSDTAANLTLTIGSNTFRFRMLVGVVSFAFPYIIDRGIDLSGTLSASSTADVYLIGTAE